jgi:hypothetical protein
VHTNSSTAPAAAEPRTQENPRRGYATGSAGLATLVRGSSRRIMIMRFRPANIRLINRRFHLTRLPLALCSKTSQPSPTYVQRLTGSLHISPGVPECVKLPDGVAWCYESNSMAIDLRWCAIDGIADCKDNVPSVPSMLIAGASTKKHWGIRDFRCANFIALLLLKPG